MHNHGKYEIHHLNQHNHSAPLIVISWAKTVSHNIRMSNRQTKLAGASHNLHYSTIQNKQNNKRRGNILKLIFEIYRSENDFYYGHSYIERHDERIRFNGQTNDRCAADRELEIRETIVRTQKVGFVSAKIITTYLHNVIFFSQHLYITSDDVMQRCEKI